MNWYKKAQSYKEFPTWLSQEISKYTHNYTLPIPEHIDKILHGVDPVYDGKKLMMDTIEDWIKEKNPDLSKYTLQTAAREASSDHLEKTRQQHFRNDPYYEKQLNERSRNAFLAEIQNINPDLDNFGIDVSQKGKSIPPPIKKKINNEIYDLGNFHTDIPLKTIIDICQKHKVIVMQEDGKKWSGFLIGGAECGSKEAEKQIAHFDLAFYTEDRDYIPANNTLNLAWCVMGSGKYEVVCYLA
jgi:hypothetical protein